jgi:hypothetical protein
MNKYSLLAMYTNVDYNLSQFKEDIAYLGYTPDYESFDNSLAVYKLDDFIMIACKVSGGLSFIDKCK